MPAPRKSQPSRTELKARTREKLLEAAIATLIEEGYAGFSMNKVAKRAGIAQPSFYVHFANTEQLLEALAADVLDRFIKPFQISVTGMVQNLKQEEARGLIFRLFMLAFDITRSRKALVRMVWAEREQRVSPFGIHLRQLFAEIKSSWGGVLVDVGLAGRSDSDRLRLELFMDSVFALFETYARAWLEGRYTDVEFLANTLTDYVLFYWQREMTDFFTTANGK